MTAIRPGCWWGELIKLLARISHEKFILVMKKLREHFKIKGLYKNRASLINNTLF
jgi:hypothetical protein